MIIFFSILLYSIISIIGFNYRYKLFINSKKEKSHIQEDERDYFIFCIMTFPLLFFLWGFYVLVDKLLKLFEKQSPFL